MAMKTLEQIYWLRVVLGIVAAIASIGFNILAGTIETEVFTLNQLMNGMAMALLVYLLSYYVIKAKFRNKVEKPQKLLTMGIFIYFFAWLVIWILLYSILRGPPPAT